MGRDSYSYSGLTRQKTAAETLKRAGKTAQQALEDLNDA